VAARKSSPKTKSAPRRPVTAEQHRVRRQQHESEAAQDYCEAIAEMLETGVEARVGRIAERFGLSHVTVSRVVRRLASEGFVVAQPHQPLGLTARGKALAAERSLCEPTAIATATAACAAEPHGTLFHGSSMPIRDADFLAIAPPAGWETASNRGASGIDGLIASATGHAVASAEPVVAILGDVSTLHDLNSLQLAAQVETPLVLVVLNNDGGGIFRYLPIARHEDVFEACFTTPHGLSFAPIAKSFGLATESPRTRAALAKAMSRALRRGGTTVIEIACTRESSEECRARVAKAATAALARDFR